VHEKSSTAPLQTTGDYIRISIEDQGIGFDEMYLSKIFAIFQRLHTQHEYEGTGIGLAIVKKIVEKHNGLISAESKKDEGSTFHIVLPVQQSKIYLQAEKSA
jgi:light-regulated signal transduction histidine kinase (bacteriophytochrome)